MTRPASKCMPFHFRKGSRAEVKQTAILLVLAGRVKEVDRELGMVREKGPAVTRLMKWRSSWVRSTSDS